MIRCSFDANKLVAVSSDGDSAMNCLARLIKEEIVSHVLYLIGRNFVGRK